MGATFAGAIRLARDAEMKHLREDRAVIEFSAAWDHGWGDKKKGCFIRVSYWRNRPKLCELLQKGKTVFVRGALYYDEVEKDGQKRQYWKVEADDVELISSGSRDGGGRGSEPPKADGPYDDDEPPF